MSRGTYIECDNCKKLEKYPKMWMKLELLAFGDDEERETYLQELDSCSYECTRRLVEQSENQMKNYEFWKKSRKLRNNLIDDIGKFGEEPFSSEQDALNTLQMIVAKHKTESNKCEIWKEESPRDYYECYQISYLVDLYEEHRESIFINFEKSHGKVKMFTHAERSFH